MPDPIHFRKTEMDARFLPLGGGEGQAFRVKTDGTGTFLQLKDSASEQFRSAFLTNGALQTGPAEE